MGLTFTAITLIACVTSLISIVTCLDIGKVTQLLPNSTQHTSGKSPQNLSNNALQILESEDRSTFALLGGKDSNNHDLVYLAVPDVSHNMSAVPDVSHNMSAVPDVSHNMLPVPDVSHNMSAVPDVSNMSAVSYVSHNMSAVLQERTDQRPLGDTTKQMFKTGKRMNGLEWLQNIYNPHLWGSSPPGQLGTKCGEDMKTYLAALNNGSVWAAKSEYTYCACHTLRS